MRTRLKEASRPAQRSSPRAALALACSLLSMPAGGTPAGLAPAEAAEPRQIDIAYLPPNDPVHQPLYELLKSRQVLEKLRAFLAPFRLPKRVLMKTESCDGVANAYSGGGNVTVCYEYLDEIWRNVPAATTPEGVTPVDALVGPLVDVFFHELGHVVFALLDVPVLGREEDAADQFSAYLMLHLGPDEARRLIGGAAYQFKSDLRPQLTLQLKDFSNTHGAPAVRFYNLLCIAFGADAQLFDDIVSKGYLPVERAIGCEDEYRQLATAFTRLIGPSIDKTLAGQVMAMRWLPDPETMPQRRPETAPGTGETIRPAAGPD